MTTTSGADPAPGCYFGRLVLQPLEQDLYQLHEHFGYCDRAGTPWPVPAGFVTDGASIPRPLWRAVGHPFKTDYIEAAVIHDHLYAQQVVARARADRLFLEAMEASGCSKVKRWALYLGVRIGGWLPWRLHAERRAQRIGKE